VNMMQFCKEFNGRTADKGDTIIPVVITIYGDRSFTFILKTPPASILIKQALGLKKGSAIPNRDKVGQLTQTQLREIAQTKMPDLNAGTIEAAMQIIAGSARSMGVDIIAE
jgi:large subunit ribosomal protein L11